MSSDRRLAVRVYPPGYGPMALQSDYRPWEADLEFYRQWKLVHHATMVDAARLYELWQLVEQVIAVPGDVLEVGTWRGGSAALIAARARALGPSRRLWVADTFAGVANAGPEDPYYEGGEHADTSEEQVRALFTGLGIDDVRLLRGVFPADTASDVEATSIALCHIDVDVYRSARDTFEWVWPRVPLGGVVVFDDHGFLGCEGVTRCVHEIRSRSDGLVIENANGHAIVVRVQDTER